MQAPPCNDHHHCDHQPDEKQVGEPDFCLPPAEEPQAVSSSLELLDWMETCIYNNDDEDSYHHCYVHCKTKGETFTQENKTCIKEWMNFVCRTFSGNTVRITR